MAIVKIIRPERAIYNLAHTPCFSTAKGPESFLFMAERDSATACVATVRVARN